MGDFTTVGGLPRQQIFMLDLATTPTATVTGWTSPQWDGSQGEATPQNPNNGYPYECATVEPFYIQAAAWSPDDSTIYIGTTGYHPNGWPTGSSPRNGLCDAAAAFPATQASVLSNWINYTGCDSLYAAAADAGAAYFGGHERWSMNPNGCDFTGTGRLASPGIEGLRPATGCSRSGHADQGPRPGRRRHADHLGRAVDRQRQLFFFLLPALLLTGDTRKPDDAM